MPCPLKREPLIEKNENMREDLISKKDRRLRRSTMH